MKGIYLENDVLSWLMDKNLRKEFQGSFCRAIKLKLYWRTVSSCKCENVIKFDERDFISRTILKQSLCNVSYLVGR